MMEQIGMADLVRRAASMAPSLGELPNTLGGAGAGAPLLNAADPMNRLGMMMRQAEQAQDMAGQLEVTAAEKANVPMPLPRQLPGGGPTAQPPGLQQPMMPPQLATPQPEALPRTLPAAAAPPLQTPAQLPVGGGPVPPSTPPSLAGPAGPQPMPLPPSLTGSAMPGPAPPPPLAGPSMPGPAPPPPSGFPQQTPVGPPLPGLERLFRGLSQDIQQAVAAVKERGQPQTGIPTPPSPFQWPPWPFPGGPGRGE